MKSKVTKKVLRVFLYFIGVLIFLFTTFYFAFRSPGFQTWAANRAAWYLSNQWGAKVTVDGVDIEFWKKIVLEGVYIEDQHRDTLLYAEKLKLDIGTFDRDSQNVYIDDVILQNSTVKLKEYKGDSIFNFQFILDKFSSQDTLPKDSTQWKIAIKGITLENIRFAFRMESDTAHCIGINYFDLHANAINAKISNIYFDTDTTHCTIENFSLRERCGLELKDFTAVASISPVLIKLDQLKIFTNNSQIVGDYSMQYRSFSDFLDYNNKVKMKSKLKTSHVEMEDVAFFSDPLYGMKKKVLIQGDFSGTVSDLKGKNIYCVVGDHTKFTGNFSMTGLPEINQTYMSFDAKELITSKMGIEDIPLPPFNEKHSIPLPDNISLFGTMKFKGNFSGYYYDFVSYGNFNTALGQISTDISLKEDTLTGRPSYHGKFACQDFELGRFFESEKYVGNLTMNANIQGKGFSKENAAMSVEGSASSLGLKGYNYHNIDLKGKLARNIFNGLLTVKDENLVMDFNGDMDFSRSPTMLNFTSAISKANLSRLNILNAADSIGITAKVTVNAVGNNIDDVIGKMKLSNVKYSKAADVFDFKNIELTVEENAGSKTLNFNSSMADAHLNGKFKPMEVATCLNDFLSNYLPTYVPRLEGPAVMSKKSHKRKSLDEHLQQFSFDVQLKNMDLVTRAFVPSLNISTPVGMKGNYDEEKNDFSLTGDFPSVILQSYKFSKCGVALYSEGNHLVFKTNCQRINLADSAWIDHVSIASAISNDTANFAINWDNGTEHIYKGDIPGFITFSEPSAGRAGKHRVKLKLKPSAVTIADSSWVLKEDNEVVMDSTFIGVKNLNFICGHQRVKLEGNISEVKEEHMYLMLSTFALANFNSFLKGTGFALYGSISGNTSIGNLYDKPLFESKIDIQSLQMNKELIGNGSLVSEYDSKKDMINFTGLLKREGGDNLKFGGNYFPSKKENSLDVDAEVHDFRLEFFDPFVKDICQNMRGIAGAKLKIRGTPSDPLITGTIHAKADNLHVNYLGTDYHFEGDVAVEPNSFDFSKLHVYDVNANMAEIVNGKIFHTNFKKFQLDFDVSANKFLALNTTAKDNTLYYGKVFATGILNVFGFIDNINLTAAIRSDKAKDVSGKNEYSQLFIPLSGSEDIDENSFISFVKNDAASKAKSKKYKVNTGGFTMDIKLQPSVDAQVQLIFDEKVGDIIKANGTGDIEMVINEFGDFKMYGDYLVTEGDYLFTLKNVVNKKFKLDNGGTVHWSGDPGDADINMNAIYRLKTSLAPLFQTYELTDLIKKRYPVDCVMNLTGKLLKPDIAFDIKLPSADDFIRQQSYDKFKNTENGMNQQVFSLLFTNSFSPPTSDLATGPGAGTVTSTEMLSNQLSNWLSQISKEFDVGVHYRPGDEVNKDQVELALSTQLFNDKLTIDGSVANNANAANAAGQNTSNVVGDVNIDYKLTEDGKIRAKAYNKANEGDILNLQKGPYTQGVGIFYRKEFEHIFRMKNKK